jgi:hypothetical protein
MFKEPTLCTQIRKIIYNNNVCKHIHNCRIKIHFVGLKMQFCWTKNVILNIRNVELNWFLSD